MGYFPFLLLTFYFSIFPANLSWPSSCAGLISQVILTRDSRPLTIKTALIKDVNSPSRPEVFLLSLQSEVTEPEKIESIKQTMLDNTFDYEHYQNRIGGYYQSANQIFYIAEGNHRMAAALEIAKETLDWSRVKKLLANGAWNEEPPRQSAYYKMNVRTTFWNTFSWRKFLSPITPSFRQIHNLY